MDFRSEYRAVKKPLYRFPEIQFRPWWSWRWRYVGLAQDVSEAKEKALEHALHRKEKPEITNFGRLPPLKAEGTSNA